MTDSTASTDNDQIQPMTVGDLIEAPAKFPPDHRVVVNGYEDGYDNVDAESLSTVSVRPKPGHKDWEGENEDAGWTPGENDFEAVCIARRRGF